MTNHRCSWRTLLSFWIFGLCNNFSYTVMLSAAQDILKPERPATEEEQCIPEIVERGCQTASAGIVLLCNVVPTLAVKLSFPFFQQYVPYGVRQIFVSITMAISLILVASANTVTVGLIGVLFGSLSGGLGEISLLAMTSHYSKHSVSTWASGTGMAGIAGSFSYAALTDPRLLNLTPSQTMLVMLVVPLTYAIAYYFILEKPSTVKKVSLVRPGEWIDFETTRWRTSRAAEDDQENRKEKPQAGEIEKIEDSENGAVTEQSRPSNMVIAKVLAKYMIPLFFVYFAEYLINQGLLELTIFKCSRSFDSSPRSQYKWYQVWYQIGVFISRSSINLIQLNYTFIALMPMLQMLNAILFLVNAIYSIVPHFAIVSVIVFYEGLIGGASYVNSFNHIHKHVDPSIREFSLSIASVADTSGIVCSAFVAIPIHNIICQLQWIGIGQ